MPMKTIALNISVTVMLILLISQNSFATGAYVLKNTLLTPNDGQAPPIVEYTENGGNITYDVLYNSSCKGSYQLSWFFSKDITRLAEGDEFDVNIQCTVCQDICGFKWGTARGTAGGANNLTSIPGVDDYVYNGNIELTSPSAFVDAWNPENHSQQYDFNIMLKKNADNSGFYLTLGSHRIIYHYTFDDRASSSIQSPVINADFDIFIPSATFKPPIGITDIWLNLEFKGLDADGDLIWRLKDYNNN